MRARRTSHIGDESAFTIGFVAQDTKRNDGGEWYVYLLPLSDCTSFKVGLTSQPLQRVASFHRRYFEYIDLRQASLLRTDDALAARAVESSIKAALAAYRMAAPSWVSPEAGGFTEWFSAVQLSTAEELLCSQSGYDAAPSIVTVAEYVRARLEKCAPSFELWACDRANRVCEDRVSMRLGYERTVSVEPLRNWLDAYRYFDIPLFKDDPEAAAHVLRTAHS